MFNQRMAYSLAQRKAIDAVRRAVRSGDLPKLPQDGIQCADCTNDAAEYDHRDYSFPLRVTPVCCSCNRMRGVANGKLEKTNKEQCPQCGGFTVQYTRKDNAHWCRRCGASWKKE